MHTASRAIDVHLDIPCTVCTFQEKQLCCYDVGYFITDGIAKENDTVHHQPAIYIHHSHIHGAFFDDVGGKISNSMIDIPVQGIAADPFVLYSVFLKLDSKIHIDMIKM